MGEEGLGRVRVEDDVVEVAGGVVDLADYEVVLGGDVLGFCQLVRGIR